MPLRAFTGLVAGALLAGCALQPREEHFTHYCGLTSHVPCLDQIQPPANCVPCPTAAASAARE